MKIKISIILLIALLGLKHSLTAAYSPNRTNAKIIFPETFQFKKIDFNSGFRNSVSPFFGDAHCENLFIGKTFHNDPVHFLNFQYKDKKKGIAPFVAPTLLIATGTALHFSTGLKTNFQDWVQTNLPYSGHIDDYIQYAPGIAVYALNTFGVKGKNNFGNRTAIVLKTLLLNDLMVSSLKSWTDSKRPNGDPRSFPSGHTSVAFAFAQLMHNEFGDRSIWYSIGAYTCATTVGLMRVSKNAHWISDVVAGAGFGMLSTELVYLTHLYKWDNDHIKNFDIFPWRSNRQTGVTMIYTF
jgi:membrane-associated phospholipid phosphatase